jgi:pilus assembly protein CpaE
VANVNVVVLVVELTLASARDAIRMLSWLKTHAAHARVIVVANKVQPSLAEITKADFEASIEASLQLSIPYDLKAASMAAKLGQTFADTNRSNRAGAAMRDLSRLILEETAGPASSAAIKPSLLGKLDLKAFMGKAAKKEAAPR